MEGQKQCPECHNYKVNEKNSGKVWFYFLIVTGLFSTALGTLIIAPILFVINFFLLGYWYSSKQYRSARVHSLVYGVFWTLLAAFMSGITSVDGGQLVYNFIIGSLALCIVFFIISFMKIKTSSEDAQTEYYRCDSCGYEWTEKPPKEQYA
ncbi:hypothetical protein [Salibacterium halotolerans]|uniref:Uncharacterized protein n=1 Tax=Salibacterium halotolerans TaxID=1884432 RepID=A0A1I5NAT1_9BACI|nr:hypothetical protein [Salibacterium halotolerans]SFP18879.1 hypothetical protein SAMN05518683_10363 [Salibacterium halotolerans]